MKYYARIENLYYRLFTIEERYDSPNPENNFIKCSISIEPEEGRHLATYERTIHPAKIQVKTVFRKGTTLIGDYKRKELVNTGESPYEIETLYEFGYDNLREGLVGLCSHSHQNGFAGRKAHSSIKEGDKCVNFPDDSLRPYWMGTYFTTYDCEQINNIFRHEDIDKILFYKGERGNVVTLLKFITPEWETLKLTPGDKTKGWIHPSGSLSARYHIQILG